MFPVIGPLLYFILGMNRIKTRARKLESLSPFRVHRPDETVNDCGPVLIPPGLTEIARMSDAITRRPVVSGNRVEPLHNGEAAYPAMLAAIGNAEQYIFLTTYIFETNTTGQQFVKALAKARARGVEVRVIIDGVGEWYSLPRVGHLLEKQGIRFVRFLPPRLFPPAFQINLRNHRKLMVVDGKTAFAGGMNIGDRHLAEKVDNSQRVMDMHFRLSGPVVSQIEEIFLEDWRFSTQEHVSPGPVRLCCLENTVCRAIVDGPNVDIDRLDILLVSAVSRARREVLMMTPYFLPSRELTAAMKAAAIRGVAVHVVLPGKNNLPFVHWAMRNMFPELLESGIRIFYQPPPFVHSKLFLVDRHYAQIGSANLDTRSLCLNFELIIEIYDRKVAGNLADHVQAQRERSQEVTTAEIKNRSLPEQVRDAFFWLFTPYL